MRILLLLFCLSLFGGGCARNKAVAFDEAALAAKQRPAASKKEKKGKKPPAAPVAKPVETRPIIMADETPSGQIVHLNKNGRFVVVNFSLAVVPPSGSRLNVYRDGLKVGELKVTGPRADDNTVADIVTGEARPSDEVREY